MTRRRFYAPPAAFAPDEKSVTLSEEETRHARDVLRRQSGDEIYVFDGAGREFHCVVKTIMRDSAELSVIAEVAPTRPESPLNLTLAIVLLKREKFDLVIQKATELGVTRIVPLDSERADLRLRDSEDVHNRITRWRRIAREAAKQSGRAYVPEVAAPLTFNFLLMMSAVSEKSDSTSVTRLMFSERGGKSLVEATNSLVERPSVIAALVGPEGGWTDSELNLFQKAGWIAASLGTTILRTETAVIAATAIALSELQ